MSWYVEAHGRPAPVAAKIKEGIDGVRCAEPEETIKGKAFDIIQTALSAYPSGTAVRVKASGSQTTIADGIATNTLSIEIAPLFNFVE